MDLATILASVTSSLGISLAAAAWLSRTLVSHRLDRELKAYESHLRKNADLELGEEAAKREYEFEAKKRLYKSLGPLRFQLIVACRDISTRIVAHGHEKLPFDLRDYYGRSTLFRLMRPLAISELIERQVYYADFAVDTDAIALLRFKKAAFIAFSGRRLVAGYPVADWQDQTIPFDELSRAVDPIIAGGDADNPRVIRFTEFDALLGTEEGMAAIHPLPDRIDNFEIGSKPILWLRLVAFGYLCADVVNTAGTRIGFAPVDYPLRELVGATGDDLIIRDVEGFATRCRELSLTPP